jgi:ribonuclease D
MHPLIRTADELAVILPALAAQPRIAIDTEADSLHSYFEKLCLIQISIPGEDHLVDPLAGYSLDPLFEAWRGKQLVLHGADYDLRLLRRCGFDRPTALFDTMIAARLCGIMEFSLAALLLRYYNLQITKASQKADWGKRPLSPQMTAYAVNDTHYLLGLADIFQAKLEELGRVAWFEQSCEKAIASAAVIKDRDPDLLWRLTGSNDLTPRGNAILRSLWLWREEEAKRVDRPTFHILHNEQLVIASDRLDHGGQYQPPHLRGGRLHRFEEAVARALALPEEEWPKIIRKPRLRPVPDFESRFKALKQKRDAAAGQHQLDPSLIAHKAALERLAANPDDVNGLMPWQRELMEL